MINLAFKGNFLVEFELLALTGLRVGGSKENFEIGGLDNPVIKTTATIPGYYGDKDMPAGTPYIPGSSLKGKMRSLLEWAMGRVEENIQKAFRTEQNNEDKVRLAGGPCRCGRCLICRVFGTGDAKTIENITKENPEELPGPPRLIVEELYLTKDSFERLVEETDGLITEVKTENQINRITSRANPRKVERVPAGAVFKGRMVFNVYKKSDLEEPFSLVFYGMRLLEDNYLGGYGSRGSGRVKFQNLTVKFRSKDFYLGSSKEEHLGDYKDLEALFKELEGMKQRVGGVVK